MWIALSMKLIPKHNFVLLVWQANCVGGWNQSGKQRHLVSQTRNDINQYCCAIFRVCFQFDMFLDSRVYRNVTISLCSCFISLHFSCSTVTNQHRIAWISMEHQNASQSPRTVPTKKKIQLLSIFASRAKCKSSSQHIREDGYRCGVGS